jgi:Stage II sporulation protein E (SpoIIE)
MRRTHVVSGGTPMPEQLAIEPLGTAPRDGLVLFTDGLIENRGETLDEELVGMLSGHAGRSATELVSIVHEWHVHRLSPSHGDDAVVLVARFIG